MNGFYDYLFFKLLALLDFCCFAVAFSCCGERGLLSSSGARDSHCSVFTSEAQALCARASVVEAWGLNSCCPRSQSMKASVVGACGFGSCGSQSLVGVHRLSCSVACRVFPVQELNLCLLHWQVDSSPPSHQGSPALSFNKVYFLNRKISCCLTQKELDSFCFFILGWELRSKAPELA